MKSLMTAALLAAALPAHAEEPVRSGFTLLLDVGVGRQALQGDEPEQEDVAFGLAGLNLGLGGFVNQDLAVLFRIVGTNVTQGEGPFEVDVVAGLGGPSVQYWVADMVNVELGVGFAVLSVTHEHLGGSSERGFGALAAVNVPFWSNEGHALFVGAQVAPLFFDDVNVLNASAVFGWQLL